MITTRQLRRAGIEPTEATPEIREAASKIAAELVDPGVKQFSVMLIIAIIGLITEAIKLYRDCNKTPKEVLSEIQGSFPLWRPIRRIKARRLLNKYINNQEFAGSICEDCTLDAVTKVVGKFDVSQMSNLMGLSNETNSGIPSPIEVNPTPGNTV